MSQTNINARQYEDWTKIWACAFYIKATSETHTEYYMKSRNKLQKTEMKTMSCDVNEA